MVSKGKRKALGDITAKPQKGTGEVVKRGRPTTLSKAEQGQRSLSIEKTGIVNAPKQIPGVMITIEDAQMQENVQGPPTQ